MMTKDEATMMAEQVLEAAAHMLRTTVWKLAGEGFAGFAEVFEQLGEDKALSHFESHIGTTKMLTLDGVQLPSEDPEHSNFTIGWSLPFSDVRMNLVVAADGFAVVQLIDGNGRFLPGCDALPIPAR